VKPRKIIHIDMDCFYAAVEIRDRPELRGKPLAVGGSPTGRGVIATANYEARKFGVRSAISSARAVALCPELILIRPSFSKYRVASQKVREIMQRFTDIIQPLSLDEAYLDVSDCQLFDNSATRIAAEIRRLIESETGLTASAGVAPNKFLAKIASEWNKPNGLKVIRPQDIDELVPDLEIEKIFGVGKVTAAKMHELGLRTCGDIQKLSIAEAKNLFGSWGVKLRDYAFGIDDRPVQSRSIRKSLSVERTFSNDLPDFRSVRAELPQLYQDWLERMVRAGLAVKLRTITVKLKFSDFKQTTHETAARGIPPLQVFEELLNAAFDRRSAAVRLIGLGARFAAKSETRSPADQLSLPLDESVYD
jgi:DNA polymerase-4